MFCKSTKTIKKGKQSGRQRYQCKQCNKKFQSKRRQRQQRKELWQRYVWEQSTAEQLSKSHDKSPDWIRRQLDQVVVTTKPALAKKAVIVADATFWGRSYGVLVFRCPQLKKNVYWQEITTETTTVYRQAREILQRRGCQIQAVVLDGRPGIRKVFADLPIQQCHFHQMATITRYLTRNPKLPAGKELRQIMLSLPHTTEPLFTQQLEQWHEKWDTFLKERTVNPQSGRWHYTHRRLRAAYRSLNKNHPYLFTYLAFPQLGIPNTTNGLEGVFSYLKRLLSAHHGLKQHRRLKLINEILSR